MENCYKHILSDSDGPLRLGFLLFFFPFFSILKFKIYKYKDIRIAKTIFRKYLTRFLKSNKKIKYGGISSTTRKKSTQQIFNCLLQLCIVTNK